MPALALVPADLDRSGMPGFGLNTGRMLGLSETVDRYGGFAATEAEVEATLISARFRRLYSLWLARTGAAGTDEFVESYVFEFGSADGARRVYDLLEDEGSFADFTELPGLDGAPATSELTRWEFDVPDENITIVAQDLSFLIGNLYAGVYIEMPTGSEPTPEAVRELALIFADRLSNTLRGYAPTGRPLSAAVLRTTAPGIVPGADYYLLREGNANPLVGSSDELTADWQAWWREQGITDIYEARSWLPRGADAPEDDVAITATVYRLQSVTEAKSWLRGYERHLRDRGATGFGHILAAPTFGDESLALYYDADWWFGGVRRTWTTIGLRVGSRVAFVEVSAPSAVPADALWPLAEAQAACLSDGCANLTVPVPDALVTFAGETSSGTLPPTPTTTPVPPAPTYEEWLAEQRASVAPSPTATPRPTATPTPRSAAFGFVEDFDDPRRYERFDDETVAGYVVNGGLTIRIKVPGGINTYVFDAYPTDGRGFSFAADIASTLGWGEILLIVRSPSGSTEWTFATDPTAKVWSLYRTSDGTRELYYWVEPIDYSSLIDGPVRRIEIRVRNGAPIILINGADVATPYGIPLPPMQGSVVVGFGAGINPYSLSGSGSTFSVTFGRLTLSELT